MNDQPLIDAAQPTVVALTQETQFTAHGIVSRLLFRTSTIRVVLFGFDQGQELTEHTSSFHALVQILSGGCEFSVAGQTHQLRAGDLLYMPPHAPHAVKATERFSMLLTLFEPASPQGPATR